MGDPIKVIIAGSRSYFNYSLVKRKLNLILSHRKDVEIVCGKAHGVDMLGHLYADEKGYAIKEFPADWKGYGKKAGPIRNKQMADYATHLVAFWDGKSKGTKNMIDLARTGELVINIIRI